MDEIIFRLTGVFREGQQQVQQQRLQKCEVVQIVRDQEQQEVVDTARDGQQQTFVWVVRDAEQCEVVEIVRDGKSTKQTISKKKKATRGSATDGKQVFVRFK